MADSTFSDRLREIVGELREAEGRPHGDDYSIRFDAARDMADKIESIAADMDRAALSEIDPHDLIAAAEAAHVGTTETLIHMIAATVLMKGYPHRGNETTFSPADMDEMHRRFEMTVTNEGLVTTVRIDPRTHPVESLAVNPPDDSPAAAQGENISLIPAENPVDEAEK